jgi:hypothetical protein
VGQPIKVTVRPTLDPAVREFEVNRWLTGMGRGTYEKPEEAPDGSVARMILDTGDVEAVHNYGSVITVTRKRDADWEHLSDRLQTDLQNFYIYYDENRTTKAGEVEDLPMPTDDDPAGTAAAAGDDG